MRPMRGWPVVFAFVALASLSPAERALAAPPPEDARNRVTPNTDTVFTFAAPLSRAAWETAGCRRRLDGRPDWGDDRVQVAFRRAIKDLPWAS